jgi:hypothetical protein
MPSTMCEDISKRAVVVPSLNNNNSNSNNSNNSNYPCIDNLSSNLTLVHFLFISLFSQLREVNWLYDTRVSRRLSDRYFGLVN